MELWELGEISKAVADGTVRGVRGASRALQGSGRIKTPLRYPDRGISQKQWGQQFGSMGMRGQPASRLSDGKVVRSYAEKPYQRTKLGWDSGN